MKNKSDKISMLTAYDFSFAKIIDEAGIDIILVGDSASNVMAGHETTLPITLDQMIYHASSVVRAVKRALVIVDLPFGTYQSDSKEALKSAIRIMKESGAHGVKLEGGYQAKESIERIIQAGIPVMGHLGLTPQSKNIMGGYKIQGKTLDLAKELFEDALLLQDLGCFSIVLEGVPTVVAQSISENLGIPTIGIGAGKYTDGQVLVIHDLLGMKSKEYIDAKFVKRFDNQFDSTVKALTQFKSEIEARDFPSEEHSYNLSNNAEESLKEWKKEIKKILS
jgi:3-methyl-2-oxobutanoate hydroxymethyltransferase